MNRRATRHAWILFLLTLLSVSLVTLPSGASTVTYYPREADPTPPRESVLRFAGGKHVNKVTATMTGAGMGGCFGYGPGSCGSTAVAVMSFFDSATNIKSTGCNQAISRHAVCPLTNVLNIDLQGGDDYLTTFAAAVCVSVDVGCFVLRRVSIDAGFGNDSIRTVNFLTETIVCGPGVDTVLAEERDTVASDCENVTRI